MKKSIFKEHKKYTFKDYFEFTNPTDEIAGEFGYSFSISGLDLPRHTAYDAEIIRRLNEIYITR